jgi:hypothetical protein
LLVCFGRKKNSEGMSGRCRSVEHKEDERSSGCFAGEEQLKEGRQPTGGSLGVEGEVEKRGVRVFKEIGIKESVYFSGNGLYSKVLIREAGNHRRNSNELMGGLIQRIIACSPKSNQLQKINSRSRRITP